MKFLFLLILLSVWQGFKLVCEATRNESGAVCVCGGGQLDMSDPEVAEAALKIQGAMKGMLYRQTMSLAEADSVDRVAVVYDTDVPDTSGSAEGSHASVRSGESKTSARSGQNAEDEQQASTKEEGQEEEEEDGEEPQ